MLGDLCTMCMAEITLDTSPDSSLILGLFSQLICRRHLYGRYHLYFIEFRWSHASSFDVHMAELIITQKLY